jgi:VCBS repeat-containing protein
VSGPASGVLSLSPDGSFTYTPAAGFSGTAHVHVSRERWHAHLVRGDRLHLVNSRPVAAADIYAATEDITLNVPANGVLTNDSDPDNEAITAVLVANAAHGTVTLNSNGSFAYVPSANFNGTDTFTYHATDGTRNSPDVTVTIHVAAVNDTPIAVDDRYELPIGEESIVLSGTWCPG